MSNTTSFHELSYQLHERLNKREGEQLSDLHQTWFRTDTVDYWRHQRMYAPVKPLVQAFPRSKWITIGDGHFGLDSMRLKGMEPSIDVLATDISPDCLEYAKEKGMIDKYQKVNAEKMPYQDGEFDFAFCKEAYHHFPRPYAAVYEMLRVAKKAIILIEPNDIANYPIPGALWLKVKGKLKKLLGKKNPHIDTWSYEDAGNFVYGMSKRELEKIALGLNYPTVAYHYYNDYYEAGMENEKAEDSNTVFTKFKQGLKKFDWVCKMGLRPYNKITVIIFKFDPGKELRSPLEKAGFTFISLPRNPYVNEQ
jgi:ubiquinone/menaquinone biosynthesis C-methylase UbiE